MELLQNHTTSVLKYHKRCQKATLIIAELTIFPFSSSSLVVSRLSWMILSLSHTVKIRYVNIDNNLSRFLPKATNQYIAAIVIQRVEWKRKYLACAFWYMARIGTGLIIVSSRNGIDLINTCAKLIAGSSLPTHRVVLWPKYPLQSGAWLTSNFLNLPQLSQEVCRFKCQMSQVTMSLSLSQPKAHFGRFFSILCNIVYRFAVCEPSQ